MILNYAVILIYKNLDHLLLKIFVMPNLIKFRKNYFKKKFF